MKIIPLTDVNVQPQDQIYKDSAIQKLIVGLIFIPVGIAMIYSHIRGYISLGFACFSGAGLTLFVLVYFLQYLKSLSKSNWILAVTQENIMIKFRSYLNSHLSDDDPQVVLIPYFEIESFNRRNKRVKTRGQRGNTEIEHFKLMDLNLSLQTQDLKKAIEREINLKSAKFKHNYLHVQSKQVSIVCQSSKIKLKPGINHLMKQLERKSINHKRIDEELDCTGNEVSGVEDLNEKITELIKQGDEIAAIKLAATRYSLSEAKQLVDKIK